MLTRIVTGILFAIAVGAIGRGVSLAFGLDQLVAKMIRATLDSHYLGAVAWSIGGLLGALALAGWISFRADERLYDWWSPRPALGSLYQTGQAVLRVNRSQADDRTDVQMVVDLQNANDELLAFHCILRATVNGKDLDRPVIFDGYINAKQKTSLIINVDGVPTSTTNNFASINARMRYDVTYFYTSNKNRTRRTSKLVEWSTNFQAMGVPVGTERRQEIHTHFYDEIEE